MAVAEQELKAEWLPQPLNETALMTVPPIIEGELIEAPAPVSR